MDIDQSAVSIINLGLLEIGAEAISDINEQTPNAVKALIVYPFLLKEVLQAKDWRFAKLRVTLQKSSVTPDYGYHFAYVLPADYLRLVKPKAAPSRGRNLLSEGDWDSPVWPSGFPYLIESLPSDSNMYLLINYDNSFNPLHINYIRMIQDTTKYSPTFVTALSKRIASSLAIPITEDRGKAKDKMQEYREALTSAEAVNESSDYQEDEAGGQEWASAGRGFCR